MFPQSLGNTKNSSGNSSSQLSSNRESQLLTLGERSSCDVVVVGEMVYLVVVADGRSSTLVVVLP